MGSYDWNFAFLLPLAPAFVRGALVTLEISVLSFLIGSLIGIPFGILLKAAPLKGFSLVANDAVRAIPILVLLFLVYYFPYDELLYITPPSAVVAAIIAMSIAQAAYTADIVRGAIDGVPKGSILAARSLGLREVSVYRYVVIPEVIRQILPAQVAFFIGIVRLSSLASVIGADEVVYVARVAIAQNFRSLEAWIVVAAIYIVLVLPLTWASRRLECSEWLRRRS